MERAQIDVGEGNVAAALSVVTGILALAAGPLGIAATRYSNSVTLRIGVAAGAAGAALLAFVTLALARRGRWQAARSVVMRGAGAARVGRLLGILGVCVAGAGAIALVTDAVLTHFQQ